MKQKRNPPLAEKEQKINREQGVNDIICYTGGLFKTFFGGVGRLDIN
jgi:hypothetical protein